MANGSKSLNAQLAVTKQHILELENKYGVESLQAFLKEEDLYEGKHRALTDTEARTILGAASLDEARDRIAEARQERNNRIHEEILQRTHSPENKTENLNSQNNPLPENNELKQKKDSNINNPAQNMSFNTLETKQKENIMSDDYMIPPLQRSLEETGLPMGMSIDEITDKINKNSELQPDGTLKVNNEVFDEIRHSLNKGKPFPGNAIQFMAEHNRLPTDEELKWMPKIGDPPDRTAIEFDKKDQLALYYIDRYYNYQLQAPAGITDLSVLHDKLLKIYGDYKTAVPKLDVLDNFYKTKTGQNYMDTLKNVLAGKSVWENNTSISFDPPARRADENNKRKEKSMPDSNENEVVVTERNYKEEAFKNAIFNRNIVSNALKEGRLSCLPGENGFADTERVFNIANGTHYHGENLLVLKEHQKHNNLPAAEYVTQDDIKKAEKEISGLYIKKGEKGKSIYFTENKGVKNDKGEDIYEHKHSRLFNIYQTSKPDELKAWGELEIQKDREKTLEALRAKYGENFHQYPENKTNAPGVVKCSSTEPVEYLGEYFAAVSMGSKFQVSNEQAQDFKTKFGNAIWEKIGVSPQNGEPVTNPFKLSDICNKASAHCKEVMKQAYAEQRKLDHPEQTQEQTQTAKRKF